MPINLAINKGLCYNWCKLVLGIPPAPPIEPPVDTPFMYWTRFPNPGAGGLPNFILGAETVGDWNKIQMALINLGYSARS